MLEGSLGSGVLIVVAMVANGEVIGEIDGIDGVWVSFGVYGGGVRRKVGLEMRALPGRPGNGDGPKTLSDGLWL